LRCWGKIDLQTIKEEVPFYFFFPSAEFREEYSRIFSDVGLLIPQAELLTEIVSGLEQGEFI
jgi:hypothetical protein